MITVLAVVVGIIIGVVGAYAGFIYYWHKSFNW